MSSMGFDSERASLKETVERILELKPETRSDDRELLLQKWYFETGNAALLKIRPEQLRLMSPPESVTRARRAIQAERPELRAAAAVEASRADLQEQYRQHYGRHGQ